MRAAQERFDEAIEQYRQADALWQKKESKDRKYALCNWAEALRLQEHYEQAAEKCQEAIGIDPEFPDAYNSFGLVRAAQERFDEAIEQYRQADALWQKKGSKGRKRALWNWANALSCRSTTNRPPRSAERPSTSIRKTPGLHTFWLGACGAGAL